MRFLHRIFKLLKKHRKHVRKLPGAAAKARALLRKFSKKDKDDDSREA